MNIIILYKITIIIIVTIIIIIIVATIIIIIIIPVSPQKLQCSYVDVINDHNYLIVSYTLIDYIKVNVQH